MIARVVLEGSHWRSGLSFIDRKWYFDCRYMLLFAALVVFAEWKNRE